MFFYKYQLIYKISQMEKIGKYQYYQDEKFKKQGTFGVVRKAFNLENHQIFIIKRLKTGNNQNGICPYAMRQIALLTNQLRGHKNIVKLVETLFIDQTFYLVFEEYEMDLREYLYFYGTVKLEAARNIFYQLLDGVAFAHSRGMMHRDLKSDNILVRKCPKAQKTEIAIADWGLSKAVYDQMKNHTLQVTALAYKAPQLLLGLKNYSKPVDIWALGCIFFELLTGSLLFSEQTEQKQIYKILRVTGLPNQGSMDYLSQTFGIDSAKVKGFASGCLKEILPGCCDGCVSLLKGMLSFDPFERLTAIQAMKHQFFKNG